MTDDTIVLASPASVVATLRPVSDLPAGGYELRKDRCVVEVSVRVLGRPLLRRRVAADDGTLTVGELVTLELSLGASRFLSAGSAQLALRARAVHIDEDTVVLSASGRLPRRFLHLELAAEFVR